MSKDTLPIISGKLYDLLHPLESGDRAKVVQSALALLGSPSPVDLTGDVRRGGAAHDDPALVFNGHPLGPNASRWVKQYALSADMIEQVFHFDEAGVTVIATGVPGKAKREQTVNSYMLAGARALLGSDTYTFADKDGLDLCKHLGCYDKNNHTTHRNSAGNRLAGRRDTGFTLPAPGLRAAAEVVRQIASAGGS